MSKSIYAYTTDTYSKKSWHKVGETIRDAHERIAEQDSTSTAERIDLPHNNNVWQVPDHFTDHMIHAELNRMGHLFLRDDKKREWINFVGAKTNKDCWAEVSKAINNLVHGVARPNSYGPREEQQDCVDKAVAYYRAGGDDFLMNAKMRYGKTFTSYLIAKELGYENLLIVTYKPAVKAGWKEDLESHIYFDDWHYSYDKGYDIDPAAKVNVIFASFQDINDFAKKEKWEGITDHHFDMVIIDEMHFGSETQRAQLTLDSLKFDRRLNVSGTPLNALLSGKYGDENTYNWSYQEEQAKRKLEEENGWATEIYRWLPPMHIHTYEVCDEAKQKITQHYSEDEQFNVAKLFGTKDGEFIDRSAVKMFFEQILYKSNDLHKGSQPFHQYMPDHSLWVLPGVDAVKCAKALLNEIAGSEYKVFNCAGSGKRGSEVITKIDKLKTRIRNAAAHNIKTITLSCGRFNTGTTVPQWDTVLMLNGGRAPETYFQTIFRVQSPNKASRKEACYVFDFNPDRLLELVYTQAEIQANKKKSISANVREFLEFAPITNHADNKMVEIDAEKVLSFVTTAANYVDRFASNWLFDADLGLDFDALLSLEGEVKNPTLKREVSSTGLESGKTYKTSDNKKTPAERNAEKALKRQLLEKAKVITQHIPEYIIFTAKVDNVEGILTSDKKLFEEHFGIGQEFFSQLINSDFINRDRLNRLISSLNENHVGKAIEYAREGMCVSEELTSELIEKSAIDKNGRVLVAYSYEMLPSLKEDGYTDVTLLHDKPRKSIREIAKKYGNGKVITPEELKDMKKFDAVLGNPPYQKDSDAKRWTLWSEFLSLSQKLSDNITLIIPQSVTSPGKDWESIRNHLKILNLDVRKHFNVGSTFCYIKLDMTKEIDSTEVITPSTKYNIDVRNYPFLPNEVNEKSLELLNKLQTRTGRTWKRGELHTSNKEKFNDNGKWEVLHTNAQTKRTDCVHSNLSKIRVVVTLSGYPKFEVIQNKYCSQACYWTEFNDIDEASAFADECNGEDIQEILRLFKWSGWNSREVIELL